MPVIRQMFHDQFDIVGEEVVSVVSLALLTLDQFCIIRIVVYAVALPCLRSLQRREPFLHEYDGCILLTLVFVVEASVNSCMLTNSASANLLRYEAHVAALRRLHYLN